jgi:hypothetical protein
LLIDTDRILPGPIASKCFKAVARKSRKIGEPDGRIGYFQALPALTFKTLERPHEVRQFYTTGKFRFRRRQITSRTPAVSRPQEGRFAIVRNVGRETRWTRQRQRDYRCENADLCL